MSRRLEAALLLLLAGCVQMAAQPALDSLGGTSWQLVRFRGGDDTLLVPDDKAKYTVAFAADDSVSVRLDCNRGRGAWKSAGMFLSLMADGGIYELEPANN